MKLAIGLLTCFWQAHMCSGFVVSTKRPCHVSVLHSSTAAPPPAPPSEKLTPEAQELEDILEARQQQSGDGPAPYRKIVAQTAPSVRISFPELFQEEPGAYEPGLLVASLKELGFDIVLDTNTAADLTICEEGTELLHRVMAQQKIKNGETEGGDVQEPLPLFTSCCPGWMTMVEKSAPELIPYISTCKSPHMMYGALVKGNSEELLGVPAEDVYFCSVMPCVKKRGESDREPFQKEGIRDVDNVITTKDLGVLLKKHGVDPSQLEPVAYDSPFQNDQGAHEAGFGTGTGAGQIFGTTGGVMEASVRSVYELVTGDELPRLDLTEVRGFDSLKETTIPLKSDELGLDLELRVAVINGLGEAKKLIKEMQDGTIKYDFVEVMACPGGCIGGGGQPRSAKETLAKRHEVIYCMDKSLPIRRSHANPAVKRMYEELLGKEYGSAKAKEMLHVKQVYGGKK